MKMKTQTKLATFSLLKKSEGGQSFADAKWLLEDNGISPVTKADSPYVGQFGLSVPAKFSRRAGNILFGHKKSAHKNDDLRQDMADLKDELRHAENDIREIRSEMITEDKSTARELRRLEKAYKEDRANVLAEARHQAKQLREEMRQAASRRAGAAADIARIQKRLAKK